MVATYITISISVCALVISLLTYYFNKKAQKQKQFALFADKLKQSLDNFIMLNDENHLTDFKYDLSLILQSYEGKNLHNIEFQKFYNQIQKNIGAEKNQLKLNYRELMTILITIDNKKIGSHIEWLNKVINDLYKHKNDYYNNLFKLYYSLYQYFYNIIKEDDFIKFINKFFYNIYQVCVLNEVLLYYKSYFISSIQKTLIDIKLFTVSEYSQQELLFVEVDNFITKSGIKEYINNQKEDVLAEDFKNWLSSLKKMNNESYQDILLELKGSKKRFIKNGGLDAKSYNF